ncbi:hypothetical protein FB45DRAFT_850649 [Roridomyces roridus]|uniref:Uncharacterized protein n=1 Tax=Roridomyces roridus TaxID=1738132 RepID=A0AAD7AZ99_9AGAR|nr:hypothetical protein FB45DRAFT_850649 [Roridomyces roridus]
MATSTSTPSHSSVQMVGLAILENPRKSSPRTTVFDAYTYVGSSTVERALGSLRIYHENALDLSDIGWYFLTATCAKMVNGLAVYAESEAEQAEFNFVGDIKSYHLIAAGDSEAFKTLNLALRMYIMASGVVTVSDTPGLKFVVEPEQYTQAYADKQKASTDATPFTEKSIFPIEGRLDPNRYRGNKKPVPWVKRMVSFGGFLTDIASALDGDTPLDRFVVDVDNIAFFGAFTPPATPAPMASGSTPSAGEQVAFHVHPLL